MDEFQAHSKEEVSLGVSYEGKTVDITLSVGELLQHKNAVMVDLLFLLKRMIQGDVQHMKSMDFSTPSIRKLALVDDEEEDATATEISLEEEEEESDEIPTPPTQARPAPKKRKRRKEEEKPKPKKRRSKSALSKEEGQLDRIAARISAWTPDSNHPKREKGKVMYLELLGCLKALLQQPQAPLSQLQPMIRRIQTYWGSKKGAAVEEETFLSELTTLIKECRSLPQLRTTLFSLIQEFKSSCS